MTSAAGLASSEVPRRSLRRPAFERAAWIVLAVAVAVALVVGWHRPSGSPRAQEIATLERDIKCPSCDDLSVAVSTAPTAIAVRHTIVRRIDEGQTPTEVEQYLISRYGTAILLDPPTSGPTLLVWVLPGLAGVVAAGALGGFLWRRSRAAAVAVEADDEALVRAALAAMAGAAGNGRTHGSPETGRPVEPGP
ncbi:cytochrome c-type biogenesis protein CcmH [Aciditerrimonas ferrireducens]|jgi:cytochrome c-type biogenesis protein CcmH|uniref:Cytochrome c-type biogenesis protein n=1 Tax=Aciditerrimonas ferrireducens TaxID=667306 RepID=A0ABV6C516_9ACTN|nr:cytochrome c-type biogenesis protein CcmH [Aciditerrimonas ferrireducens]MCK4177017.1 cytochrome c-type biogenesis protein CcmH [Aciditerrimonas ferrireducens]